MDTDVQMMEQTETQTEAQPQQTEPEATLNDALDDPLAEGGDSVQMAVPPKPGAGPKVGDRFESVEDVAAQS